MSLKSVATFKYNVFCVMNCVFVDDNLIKKRLLKTPPLHDVLHILHRPVSLVNLGHLALTPIVLDGCDTCHATGIKETGM